MNIIVAGDFAPRARLEEQIERKRYDEIFSDDIVKIIRSADYSIVNLESPVADTNFQPIIKEGPSLKCSSNVVDALKYAGFKGVSLANNHILDYGEKGLLKTIECCKRNGIDIVGVGKNLEEASHILYYESEGIKLAIINCCEHEFSIAKSSRSGAYPLSPVHQFYKIKEARSNADYVIVIVHGGHEHYQFPSPRMQDTYRFFIDSGADAVINHHQHCFSGYETYQNKLIFYGIGNFAFDMEPQLQNTPWNYGYMVELSLENNISFSIHPYCQYSRKAGIQLLDRNSFDSKLCELNRIILNRTELEKQTSNYYNSCSSSVLSILEPIQNRIIHGLQTRGVIPSLITKKWIVKLSNLVNCESHKDKLTFFLERQ